VLDYAVAGDIDRALEATNARIAALSAALMTSSALPLSIYA
jgi:hypothetical protein